MYKINWTLFKSLIAVISELPLFQPIVIYTQKACDVSWPKKSSQIKKEACVVMVRQTTSIDIKPSIYAILKWDIYKS